MVGIDALWTRSELPSMSRSREDEMPYLQRHDNKLHLFEPIGPECLNKAAVWSFCRLYYQFSCFFAFVVLSL